MALLVVAAAATPVDAGTLFESTPLGPTSGGGQGISNNILIGQSFRITERSDVTSVGAYFDAWAATSLQVSIVPVGGPWSFVQPSTFLGNAVATSTLSVPAGAGDVAAPLAATLDRGWYSLVLHTDASGWNPASMPPLTTARTTSQLYYTVNRSTGAGSYGGGNTRFFVEGDAAPLAPDPDAFTFETANPAFYYNSSTNVDATRYRGTRLEITEPTRLTSIGGRFGGGNGTLFGAIVALSGPDDMPNSPDLLNFTDTGPSSDVLATTIITLGDESGDYAGDVDIVLDPGHYAMVFGSGRFGATGGASIPMVEDLLVGSPTFIGADPTLYWFDSTLSSRFRFFANGVVPEPTTAALLLCGAAALLRRRSA